MMDLKTGLLNSAAKTSKCATSDTCSDESTAEVDAIVRELEERQLISLAQRVAERHHIRVEEILGKRRRPTEVRARWELWSYVYERAQSGAWVARLFRRDRSTILTGLRRYKKQRRIESVIEATCSRPC